MSIYLSSVEEYDYAVSRGYVPLLDSRFRLNINVRVEIQHRLFGRNRTMKSNDKFFHWVWEHKPHYCEETMRPLQNYSAVYCSHILTRGGHPEMATDPRNINLLTFEMHNRWENGDRENMRIYDKNMETIRILRREYLSLKK